tara:strand:- start:7730 stop:8338 length:609 start_codon:yes stop_codon:yes gene_type:complete
MKSFLTTGRPKTAKEMQIIRKNNMSKWDSLGFLDGLKGLVRKDIAQLYESEASHLLNESAVVYKKGYKPLAVKNMEEAKRIKEEKLANEWSARQFLSDINNEISNSLAESLESEASYLLGDYYSVYMVECSDGSIYTGIAKDVSKRILTHNKGKGAKYTKTRLPVALKWEKLCRDRSMASKYEYRIKKLTRKQKLKLIEHGR